jgi:hypothetical protein
MTNWIMNKLEVGGDKDELLRLIEFTQEGLDFNRIDPMPEALYHTLTHGRVGIHEGITLEDYEPIMEWYPQHWGADGAYRQRRSMTRTTGVTYDGKPVDSTEVKITFETRWAPGYFAIRKLSELFPTLNFTYSWYTTVPGEAGTEGYNRLLRAGKELGQCPNCEALPEEVYNFDDFSWFFCVEHKVGWCAGRHSFERGSKRNSLAEFYTKFGYVTLADLAHRWDMRSSTQDDPKYRYTDSKVLQRTLVHLLEKQNPDNEAALHFGVHSTQLPPEPREPRKPVNPDDEIPF